MDDINIEKNYKLCKTCGEVKKKTEFRAQRAAKDSLYPKCKKCQDRYQKGNYLDNKEHKLKLITDWQKKEENIQKVKDYKKAYYHTKTLAKKSKEIADKQQSEKQQKENHTN